MAQCVVPPKSSYMNRTPAYPNIANSPSGSSIHTDGPPAHGVASYVTAGMQVVDVEVLVVLVDVVLVLVVDVEVLVVLVLVVDVLVVDVEVLVVLVLVDVVVEVVVVEAIVVVVVVVLVLVVVVVVLVVVLVVVVLVVVVLVLVVVVVTNSAVTVVHVVLLVKSDTFKFVYSLTEQIALTSPVQKVLLIYNSPGRTIPVKFADVAAVLLPSCKKAGLNPLLNILYPFLVTSLDSIIVLVEDIAIVQVSTLFANLRVSPRVSFAKRSRILFVTTAAPENSGVSVVCAVIDGYCVSPVIRL